jgi:hypothetical protein
MPGLGLPEDFRQAGQGEMRLLQDTQSLLVRVLRRRTEHDALDLDRFTISCHVVLIAPLPTPMSLASETTRAT